MAKILQFDFFGSYTGFRPFIITVNSGADNQFTIPTAGTGYNYSVKTSDGQNFSGVTGNLTINFPSADTDYDIEITGIFPSFYVANNSERAKVIYTKQWGDIKWRSFVLSYTGCVNWQNIATDVPDFSSYSNVNGMSDAFNGCQINNSSFNGWNYTPISNINRVWFNNLLFNQPVNLLDWSNIVVAQQALSNAKKFNQSLSALNFSKMESCLGFLSGATDYAQPFDQSSPITGTIALKDIRGMFQLTKVPSIKMQAGVVDTLSVSTFQCNFLTVLELYGMSVSFTIQYAPNLVGVKIDSLVASLKDMTGFASPTLTVLTAQSLSGIDTAAIAAKNWTLAIV